MHRLGDLWYVRRTKRRLGVLLGQRNLLSFFERQFHGTLVRELMSSDC
jgi:hypothetical protein